MARTKQTVRTQGKHYGRREQRKCVPELKKMTAETGGKSPRQRKNLDGLLSAVSAVRSAQNVGSESTLAVAEEAGADSENAKASEEAAGAASESSDSKESSGSENLAYNNPPGEDAPSSGDEDGYCCYVRVNGAGNCRMDVDQHEHWRLSHNTFYDVEVDGEKGDLIDVTYHQPVGFDEDGELITSPPWNAKVTCESHVCPRIPTHAHTCPRMTTHAHTCPHMPTHAHTCPRMPTHAQTCPNMPTHAHTCPHIPTHAHTCPRMPTHAHVCPHTAYYLFL